MIRSASGRKKKGNSSTAGPKNLAPSVGADDHSLVVVITKLALLEGMMRRPEGATTPQLMLALGWQKHSVRGAISGALRKKKNLHVNVEEPADGERIYRILDQS